MAGPIETKVKAASVAAYLGSTAGLSVLQAVDEAPLLIAALPDWLEPILLAFVPAAITAVAAYRANHTPRTDDDARRAGPLPL